MMMGNDQDEEFQTQKILLAAAQHDTAGLRGLLRTGSANVQDPETGYTPLHAAIAACDPVEQPHSANGHANGDGIHMEDISAAETTMKLLFENGAIWNDLDALNETPGCLALRLGLIQLYDIIVEAGVRAELLLMRLDEYTQLTDGEHADEEDENEAAANDVSSSSAVENETFVDQETTQGSPVQLLLTEPGGASAEVAIDNSTYLQSALEFRDDKLIDCDSNGVMMAWETEIMKRSAEKLLPVSNLRVLNVGHGMGIVDNFFQTHTPETHHIIEAHPDVLTKMSTNGWRAKSNVTVHPGTWQDVVPILIEQNTTFDAIYFDTFAEDYKALREFFTEYVIALLKPGGRFGFFHGLGGDRQICYDVYTKVGYYIAILLL